MAGRLTDEDQEITEINVTPFVDVMLVLLVIFMVTANYIVNQSINVNLPDADTGEASSAVQLEFTLDANSQVFMNGRPVSFENIDQVIAEQLTRVDSKQAMIAADEKTPHGTVIKLLDAVRRNGVTEFAINVENHSAMNKN